MLINQARLRLIAKMRNAAIKTTAKKDDKQELNGMSLRFPSIFDTILPRQVWDISFFN